MLKKNIQVLRPDDPKLPFWTQQQGAVHEYILCELPTMGLNLKYKLQQ